MRSTEYENIYSECRRVLGTMEMLALASELLIQVIDTLPQEDQIVARARVFGEIRRVIERKNKAARIKE